MAEMTPEYRARIRRRYVNTPIPASETEEGKERIRAYYLALGQFVDRFAMVETAMYLALRWYTKSSMHTARAVFSGIRTHEAASFMRRLAEGWVIEDDEWALLEPILVQLGKINDVRNRLLHSGATGVAEGKGQITNALRALTEDRVETIPISDDILRAMTADLQKIQANLYVRHMGRPAPSGQHDWIDELLQRSWLYTPESPPAKPRAGKGRKPRT